MIVGQKGDLKNAIKYAEMALKARPDYPEYVFTLAFYQLQAGQKTTAVNSLKKAVSLNPGDLTNVQLLAQIYLQDGNTNGALKLYKDALNSKGVSDQDT